MDIKENSSVSPPNDETTYKITITDYGQGNDRLTVAPNGDRTNEYHFSITNSELQECQWRADESELPTPVLRAVEHHGYHVTNVNQRPTHGLYEHVTHLKNAVKQTETAVSEQDVLSRAGLNWTHNSLDALAKLELLRAHLTEPEYDIVLFKAQHTSRNHPPGHLTIPLWNGQTTASLNTIVVLMLAYAQHDGYLPHTILDDNTVQNLVEPAPHTPQQ